MVPRPALVAMLLAVATVPAAAPMPAPGSHGFDWLDPEGAQCREITAADIATFTACEASDNGFGLALASHRCTVDEGSEYMVYATAAECEQALETMQANGP